VHLERGRRGLGRRSVPELVDQAVAGDDPVRVQEQKPEQAALLRAPERNLAPVLDGLERAEDPELDARAALL
jgi:hypothetical protein